MRESNYPKPPFTQREMIMFREGAIGAIGAIEDTLKEKGYYYRCRITVKKLNKILGIKQ